MGNTLLNNVGTVVLTTVFKRSVVLGTFNFFGMYDPFRSIFGHAFAYFCIGGCAYDFVDKIIAIPVKKRNTVALITLPLSCFGAWMLGICYSRASQTEWDVVWNGYDTLFTVVNVLCMFILSLNYDRGFKVVKSISINTLGIYLSHSIVHIILIRIGIGPHTNIAFGLGLLYSLVVLIISWVVSILQSKTPILSRLVK